MAHFAEIDLNNKVIRVLKISNSEEHRGQEFLSQDLNLGGVWLQTSYNTKQGIHVLGGTPFRKNFAGIGYSYDTIRDAFIPPKFYPSWVLNEDKCIWEPPFFPPNDGKKYIWNESIVDWTPFPENPSGPFAWSEINYSWVFKPQDGRNYKWNKTTYTWDLIS